MIEVLIKISRRTWRESIAILATILIKPVLRERHSPEYTARGVGLGLFVAFTPFFGIHIAIVFALWAAAKIVNVNLTFNPVLASAWTLLSNVFTIAPLYYVFIQTGRFMLGRWEHIQNFESYLPEFEQTVYIDTGWIEGMWIQVVDLLADIGVLLLIGCLPWAIVIGLIGYLWSLYFIRRHRASFVQ